jgi:hypothetical protein
VATVGMHAWPEVYLPVAARALSSDAGLLVADAHVAFAVCREPRRATSIEESFRGEGVSQKSKRAVHCR